VEDVDPDIAELADMIANSVAGGNTEERAAQQLAKWSSVPADVILKARRLYGARVGRIRDARDPSSLVDTKFRSEGWYAGSREGDIYWPSFRSRLTFEEDATNSLENRANRIVSLLGAPGGEMIDTRGLVLGHVQSGKTTSFMSVIAKAADAGYRVFIILSGITDNLRSQTQERVAETLVGMSPEEQARWHWLTNPDKDFSLSPQNAANILKSDGSRVIAVVKKNPYRLRRLGKFLDGAGDHILSTSPVLLIDDEADQATINVAQRSADKARISRINLLIRKILSHPKVAYVAYTATPFANLLINPSDYEDLYPRDFIVDLEAPDDYFGAEKIFGRAQVNASDETFDDGLDIVRIVPDADVGDVRPPSRKAMATWEPAVPPSLEEALRWFMLATAARRAREGHANHSTMLVHTSMLTAAHTAQRETIQPYINSLSRAVTADDPEALRQFEEQWAKEAARVPGATFGNNDVPWPLVRDHLPAVLADVRVVVDNYHSTNRLSYPKDDPQTIVALGGNTLSRGLTLEGLVCSYFVRSANAYDTLLQMGRWFGYRPGYGDLVRIWMTAELQGWFFDLATVEAEIRQQISRYEAENLTPAELPVKIRTHPAMVVTAAAKMQNHVVTDVSYSGSREQTILFNHKDKDWLRANIDATEELFRAAREAGHFNPADPNGPLGGPIFKSVPVELILQFLATYRFHERSLRLNPELLSGYIKEQNELGSLLRWNVAVISDADGANGTLPIDELDLKLIRRARLNLPDPYANIKALVSRIDRAADVPLSREEIRKLAPGDTDADYAILRQDYLDRVGLLGIYPISKVSTPRNASPEPGHKARVALDAVEDVIGVCLYFPEDASNAAYRYKYIAADVSGLALDTDEPDINQLDHEDEKAGQAQEAEAKKQGKQS
jgi:Z1 domain